MKFIRQGATHKVVLGPAVAVGDGFTPVTTLALSTADEAEAILHDNGTVVDISGYTWAAITTADGYYHLTLQSGISNTVGHMTVVVNDDSLCLPLREDFTILEEAVYDALFASSAPGYVANASVSVAQWAGTNVATPTVAGVPEVDLTHVAGSTTDVSTIPASVAAILVDTGTTLQGELDGIQADTEDIQTRLPAALVGGRIDAAVDGTGMEAGAVAVIADAVWDEATSGHTTSGTFGEQLKTDVDAILVDTGTDGVVVASGSKTGYSLTATTGLGNQTADITGSLSGSVGSVTGAVGSVTGNVGSLATQAKADVNAEVLDVLNTDTFAEPGQGAPAATTTLVAKIGYLFKAFRNRSTQTSSEYALYADDGTTKDQEAAVSDNGTTFERGEMTTGA